jgi:hypothetical protein
MVKGENVMARSLYDDYESDWLYDTTSDDALDDAIDAYLNDVFDEADLAEPVSRNRRRPRWVRAARTLGTGVIRQHISPEGVPDDLVDNLMEQAQMLYDIRHVGLLPLRMVLYTLLGRGLPPLQALQIGAQRLQLPPRRQGPGSPGRITGVQARTFERRQLRGGIRPGSDPRFRR